MRLTARQASIICNTFRQQFGQKASLWLFGSRVDDTKRGGDIDLYVQTPEQDVEKLFQAKIKFLVALDKQLGEQKIDVVLHRTGQNLQLPIYKIAQETGIKLV